MGDPVNFQGGRPALDAVVAPRTAGNASAARYVMPGPVQDPLREYRRGAVGRGGGVLHEPGINPTSVPVRTLWTVSRTAIMDWLATRIAPMFQAAEPIDSRITGVPVDRRENPHALAQPLNGLVPSQLDTATAWPLWFAPNSEREARGYVGRWTNWGLQLWGSFRAKGSQDQRSGPEGTLIMFPPQLPRNLASSRRSLTVNAVTRGQGMFASSARAVPYVTVKQAAGG